MSGARSEPAPIPGAGTAASTALAFLLVPVAAGGIAAAVLGAPAWGAVGWGALGWLVALWLRAPVVLIGRKLSDDRDRLATVVCLVSGPVEEIVRVVALTLFITGREHAVWFGLGWAAIEVVLAAVNVIVVPALLRRGDEKAAEIRDILQSQGVLGASPLYGVLERVSATALHVAFTLLVFVNPWLAVATAVVHSAANYTITVLVRRSVARAELIFAGIAAVVLAVAIVAAT